MHRQTTKPRSLNRPDRDVIRVARPATKISPNSRLLALAALWESLEPNGTPAQTPRCAG